MDQDAFKKRADEITTAAAPFIATLKFPSDAVRCESVVVLLDGADSGAQAVYAEIVKAAPNGELPSGAIPADKTQTIVCPYSRLKQCAASAGYVLSAAQDKDPPNREVRVATFTDGSVLVAAYWLANAVVGQA